MQFRQFVFCLTGPLVCITTLACAGSSKPAAAPDVIDDAALAEARQSHESEAALPDDKVGMEYEDKGDTAEKHDRTPPPTATYKPSNKVKQASVTP